MGSIHDTLRDDEVGGIIIGGDYIAGRLYYNDRIQSSHFYADSDGDLLVAANARLDEIKSECGRAFDDIFPNKSGWELRIYD